MTTKYYRADQASGFLRAGDGAVSILSAVALGSALTDIAKIPYLSKVIGRLGFAALAKNGVGIYLDHISVRARFYFGRQTRCHNGNSEFRTVMFGGMYEPRIDVVFSAGIFAYHQSIPFGWFSWGAPNEM